MTDIVWPITTIPFAILYDSYDESLGNNVYSFQPDQGPSITRPKVSSRVDMIAGNLHFRTNTQLDAFESFFETTLNNGSLAFRAIHPRKLIEAEFKLKLSEGLSFNNYGVQWIVKANMSVSQVNAAARILNLVDWQNAGWNV